MAKQFTLGKNERLKSRKLIEQLFKEGKTFTIFPFRVYYITDSADLSTVNLKLGAGAGTKNFKKAVDRNRIKRITREAWRLQKKNLQEKLEEKKTRLNVFLIYTSKELPDFETVHHKVHIVLDKLIKLVDENNTQIS